MANPDGYDYTFTTDRLWRKNLRDNDGDGQITVADGVDPNRNFPTRWGYDNEGSSSLPDSETYRGPRAGVRAGDAGPRRADAPGRLRVPDQLPLRGRAAALRHGLAGRHPDAGRRPLRGPGGRRRQPAGPGYDPDISAELYTTNGETTEHAQEAYGTLAFTPEMSTCQTASAADPRRRVPARGLRERLQVPRLRAADPGGVREEHPVRPRGGAIGAGSVQPGLGRRPHGAGLRASTRSPSPTAPRRRSPSRRGATCGTSSCTTGSPVAASSARRSRNGRAASATATKATSTTRSSAGRSPAPARATRSRSGSPACGPAPAR